MTKIKYGMPQLLDIQEIERNIQLCEKLGLNFIELNTNLPTCQPDRINVKYLNRLKKQYGVEFTIDLPEDIDLGHFNRREREAYLKIVEESIGIADRLGVKFLNLKMNSGVHFAIPNDEIELYDAYKKEYLANIKACREAIELFLGGTGVMLSIQNTGILNRPHIQEAVEMLLESHRFCLTWDLNQDYCHCGVDHSFILKHINRVKYVHLDDTILANQNLSSFNEEIIDEAFHLLRENKPTILIEVRTQGALIDSVARLKEKIIQQFRY